ncbi:WbqC-like protein family protein [bacterium A37T11]|nr:WbqC-like protein family protein [bacterium A37T11]
MEKGLILPIFYLPPIPYFSLFLAASGNVQIEKNEHFPKQTYRNRASIHSPNGVLDLIVPVVKGSKVHTAVKDVRISYESNWQRLHWMSLQTSYRRSAYFEYYEDDFAPLYEKKPTFLFDWNETFFKLLLKLLKINGNYQYTDSYEPQTPDYRQLIHPKVLPPIPSIKPYFQVFEPRNGFIPHLSIVDLLFNQGPAAASFLK